MSNINSANGNGTITIKGKGSVSLAPDLTVISLTVQSVDKDYDKSMSKSSELLGGLTDALGRVGFKKSDLKTVGFNVSARHESVRDKEGVYKSVFVGYACVHSLRLEFGFDTERLSRVLSAISGCIADPDLSVQFTVKDKDSANAALLESAAKNAREKAEILAKASGIVLGNPVAIDYTWGEHDMYSRTDFRMEAKCMGAANGRADIALTPEDVKLEDCVTFVWEIG